MSEQTEGAETITSFPSGNSPEAPQESKEQLWAQKAVEVDKITDLLGRPIDPGIKDAVVAANLLGIGTSGSCEGHNNPEEGNAYPYLDVESDDPETTKLLQQREAIVQKLPRPTPGQQPDLEATQILNELHTLDKTLEAKQLQSAAKLFDYLNEFYKDRNTPFDTRLIVQTTGGGIRGVKLESQGAIFQGTRDEQSRNQYLLAYQKEMGAFTEFLKGKFFNNPQGSLQEFPQAA